MPWPVHPNGLLGAQGDENDSYRIERSLRFNSADSAYLNRTPASITNQKTYTFNFWVKRSVLGTAQQMFSALFASTQSRYAYIGFSASDTLEVFTGIYSLGASTTSSYTYVTTQVFRDSSAWYMITVAVDTTNATASDRVKIYVNGTQVTSFSTATQPALNQNGYWNSTQFHGIGTFNASIEFFNGYLAEVNFIDGLQLTPSSFSKTDSFTGRLKAKEYSGSYGTNGYYLKFADNSAATAATIGKDSSVNANNWTPNAISVTAGAGNDSLVDSPTNYGIDTGVGGEVRGNYCTLNQLNKNTSGVLSNGNLEWQASTTALQLVTGTSEIIPSGKTYFELNVVTTAGSGTYFQVGIVPSGKSLTSDIGNASGNGYSIEQNQAIDMQLRLNGSSVTISTVVQTGDVLQVAVDYSTGKLWFGRNNTWYNSSGGTTGNPSAGTNETATISTVIDWFPAVAKYSTGGSYAINFGQRPFAYTAPSGFKALCTTNLPTPTIKKPSSYFDAVTYTGTGASNSISSLGFSPDLVWIKNRGGATSHAIYDTTRGTQAQLSSDTTGSEVTSSTGLTAFGSNGFTIGTSTLVNTSGTQYVSWAWDEAPIAGMDIVSYTGNGDTSSTRDLINHNLGVSPKMIIYKRRDAAGSWVFWHSGLSSVTQSYLLLQSADAVASSSPNTVQGTPSATAFRPRWTDASSGNNINNATYIAYLFAEVEGFSKIGSYIGNGSADGPFVYCGFRPRYALFKYTGGVANWAILDSARNQENVADDYLIASGSSAEATGFDAVDFVSNGIKIRYSGTSLNASGGTIIFAAFAESPFKYARAR